MILSKRNSKSGKQHAGVDDEENVALIDKGKKKAQKGSSTEAKQKGNHKALEKDMRKVRCFACRRWFMMHFSFTIRRGRRRVLQHQSRWMSFPPNLTQFFL